MIVLGLLAAALGVALTVRHVRRRWLMITVRGESMHPALLDGDAVLVRRCGLGDVAVGDIVVFQTPWTDQEATPEEFDRALLVKRVAAVGTDSLYVVGDNGGQDSRSFGDLPADHLVGVVARRLSRR